MSMNENDTFIREVSDELRSDQMKAIWKRFGAVIIAIALLIVAGVGGNQTYQYWQDGQASASGDRFSAALKTIGEGNKQDAQKQLEALVGDGFGSYPLLAKMRLATLHIEKGDVAAGISAFSEIGKDINVPEALRNTAKLRAAFLLIDHGTYEQVSAEVEALSVPLSAMRHSAREALGLAAFKSGDYIKAREWFQLVVDDGEAPSNVSARARMMLELVTASGKAS